MGIMGIFLIMGYLKDPMGIMAIFLIMDAAGFILSTVSELGDPCGTHMPGRGKACFILAKKWTVVNASC